MSSAEPGRAWLPGPCLLLSVVCLLGCSRAEHAAPAAPALLAPTHYLDEPFVLGDASCRLLAAEPMLTEPVSGPPSDPHEALVAEDLSVVQARFSCEGAGGVALSFRDLPTRLAFVDRARGVRVPSTRTRLGLKEPEHVVFEVPRSADGLLRPRSYDPRTGAPAGQREAASARLYLEPQIGDDKSRAAARVVIAPWPRLHDAAFDDFLDRLVRGLTNTGTELSTLSETERGRSDLELTRTLFVQTLQRGAKLLSVHNLQNVEGQARLTLALETSTSGNHNLASTPLELELTRGAVGQPVVARLLDAETSKLAVSCAARRAELTTRAERARDDATEPVRCNVLGELLPGSCEQVDAKLRDEALFVGTRCGADGALGLLFDEQSAASDFEVRLRRGRSLAGLDQSSRYVTSLTRSGVVRFDGQHRVSTRGPSEGRTSPLLLAALSDYVARLGFFERPAGTGQRCENDERGDLVTVRSNGRERSVRDRDGCRGELSAQELSGLRRAIERVASVAAWIAPDFPVFARDAEIWVVAAE